MTKTDNPGAVTCISGGSLSYTCMAAEESNTGLQRMELELKDNYKASQGDIKTEM